MRALALFLILGFMVSFSSAYASPCGEAFEAPLRDGIYRGFGPTDESEVMLGELELTVRNGTGVMKMATGLKVVQEEVSDFSRFRIVKEDGVIFIFTGGMGDLISPVILFSPHELPAEKFEKTLKSIEEEYGKANIVPRLSLNGRAS